MKTTNCILLSSCALIVLISTSLTSCKKESAPSKSVAIADVSDLNLGTEGINLRKGIVAFYPFNGDTRDYSGYRNDITFTNAIPCKGRNGRENNAYLFNGSSSYMRVANSPSLNPTKGITMYAMIQLKGYYMGQCHGNKVLTKGYDESSNGKYCLAFDDAPYYNSNQCNQVVATNFENYYGSYGNPSTNSGMYDYDDYLGTNTWYKLTFTFNGSTSKIYLNGILKSTAAKSAVFTPNSDDLFIGRFESASYPYYFNGIIDDIKIYKRALSEAEVAAL